jgi:hypothetical protein
MPEIRLRPLYRGERRRLADLLGLGALPDECVRGIAWLIAAHRECCKQVKERRGHTPARVACALRRIENRMRRGHDGPEAVREIADPLFGMDEETHSRLAPIVTDPGAPLDRKLAAIAARRSEVEALPEIDALYALRVVLVCEALRCIWCFFAVDREDAVRQWHFLLTILEAAGEATEGLRQHPERIKRDIGRLMELASQP